MEREAFLVASIQPFEPRNAQENAQMQDAAWGLAESAATQGARLVVLPEYFNVMGVPCDQGKALAANCTPQHQRAAAFCRDHGAWVLLPLIEQRQGNRFNTAHLFNPSGEIEYTYDKTHLTLGERRDYNLTAGSKITTVDTDLCPIGIMICYDVYFPEVCDVLRLEGAKLILFPSLQRSDMDENIMLLNRVRAMDAGCYLVRSSYGQKASSGDIKGTTKGGSCVVGPDGSILATAGSLEGTTIARIDPHTPWCRPRCSGVAPLPVCQFLAEDRRPELYGKIAES